MYLGPSDHQFDIEHRARCSTVLGDIYLGAGPRCFLLVTKVHGMPAFAHLTQERSSCSPKMHCPRVSIRTSSACCARTCAFRSLHQSQALRDIRFPFRELLGDVMCTTVLCNRSPYSTPFFRRPEELPAEADSLLACKGMRVTIEIVPVWVGKCFVSGRRGLGHCERGANHCTEAPPR